MEIQKIEEHKREDAEPKEDTGEAISYLSILFGLILNIFKSKVC